MNGRLYVLVRDYFSKFPFVFQTKTTRFANLKDHLQYLFMIEGTPDEIMSDNGFPFNAKEFNAFLTGLSIRHTTSSPNYSQSNGFIERQIQCDSEKAHRKSHKHWKEFSGSPNQFESTATGRWPALTSRDTLWEKHHNKKGNSSGPSCCSSVSYCLQVKYTKNYDKARWAKTQWSLVISEEVLFCFREGWMANWYSYRSKRHWEKLGHPDRQGYTTEEEQVSSQDKKLQYINNIWQIVFQDINTLPKWNNKYFAFRTATPSQSEILLQ